jgi:hypothetical protein
MKIRYIGLFLSFWITCSYTMASGYSDMDHPHSNEIFSKVIGRTQYKTLITEMNALQGEVLHPTPDTREKIVNLYASIYDIIDKTEAYAIRDSRGEENLRILDSYAVKYIINNFSQDNTMEKFTQEAIKKKSTLGKGY